MENNYEVPLGRFQSLLNKAMYTQEGLDIFPKFFVTFDTHCATPAQADAIQFQKHLDSLGDSAPFPAYVMEYAVGNGNWATSFLGYMKANGILPRISFIASDISPHFLTNLSQQLSTDFPQVTIELLEGDAPLVQPSQKPLYVRLNELWDDLYTAHLFMKDGRLHERYVTASIQGKPIKVYDLEETLAVPENRHNVRHQKTLKPVEIAHFPYPHLVAEQVRHMQDGDYMTINLGAIRHLEALVNILHNLGYVDVFDYGTISPRGVPEHRRMIDRGAGKHEYHLSSDVNFYLMAKIAEEFGFKVHLETQKEHISEALGQRYTPLLSVVHAINFYYSIPSVWTKYGQDVLEDEQSSLIRSIREMFGNRNNIFVSEQELRNFVEKVRKVVDPERYSQVSRTILGQLRKTEEDFIHMRLTR